MLLKTCPPAVIFDMDGLLVNSEPVWEKAEYDLLTARVGADHDRGVRLGLVGLRLHDFITGLRDGHHLTESVEELRTELIKRMVARIPDDVHPQPGARELLAYLDEKGIPHALASSSPREIIDGTIAAQGWDSHFAIRISGDEVPEGKPAPDIYLETARRLNVDPLASLALEDSPNGARAAVAAGMITIAVPDRSHTEPERLMAITPLVAESLHEVLAALRAVCG